MSCTIPSSTTGVLPAEMRSSLVCSTSTPITVCPSRARQARDTAPTYPSPKMLMFTLISRQGRGRSDLCAFSDAALDDEVELAHGRFPAVMGQHAVAARIRNALALLGLVQ